MRALLADQQVAVEGLRRRLDILRNEMSEPGRGPGASSGQAQQRINDLEMRLAAIERGGTLPPPAPPGTEPIPQPLPPLAGQAPVPSPRALGPQEVALAREEDALRGARVDSDYREALDLIRQGKCSDAILKLRDFIRRNPRAEVADNAQYWIGNCYYGQKDYNRAIIELNEVLLKYPKGDKVPPALLMLADAFADSGDKIDARLILQKLISDHGRSEEAEQGRQKLQSLGE